MKKINQINQYLLERYPTIWNTKLIWMLSIAFVIHLLFFAFGYISHNDPRSLQGGNAVHDYFVNGMILVHLIISLLLIVGWLIMMFKNNSFKNYYPTSKIRIFMQFVQYFIIVLASITFYFSYMFGFRTYINQKYEDKDFKKNIEIINKAYPFLSHNYHSYTLDSRLYPKNFYDAYCEKDTNGIDYSQPYYYYSNETYQYWSLYSKTVKTKDKYGSYDFPEPEKSQDIKPVSEEVKANSVTYYFKKDALDFNPFIKTTKPSYYNFSEVFFRLNNDGDNFDIFGSRYDSHEPASMYPNISLLDNEFKRENFRINKQTTELLNRKNSGELKELFSDFLNISKEYDIENNLTPQKWVDLVYHPENFEVKKFIKKYLPQPGEDYNINYSGSNDPYATAVQAAVVEETTVTLEDNADSIPENKSHAGKPNTNLDIELSGEDFFNANLTNNYYYSDNLKNLLNNVETAKNFDFVSTNIHIYIWIAIALSVLVFCFRVTGLKSLLLSGISAGVITLVVALIIFLFSMSGVSEEIYAMYFVFFVGLIILLIPLVLMNTVGKLVSSLFINITMVGFVPWILLFIYIIDYQMTYDCRYSLNASIYENCEGILEKWDISISYILLASGLIFMYFYTGILQKWKAMPEKN